MRIGVRTAAVLVLATAACGQSSSVPAPDGEPSTDAQSAKPTGLTGPPPLVLQRPEGDVDLPAYAWCFFDTGVGGCADGPEPANPPQTSATDPLAFAFPLDGWSFTASFRRPGPYLECERVIETDLVAEGDGTFVVAAPVPAGDWQVQVSGSGDANAGGSLATAFRWTTSEDVMTTSPARGEVTFLGPPSASREHDVPHEAYGPTLALSGLAGDPGEVTGALVLSGAGSERRYLLDVTGDDCPDDGTIAMISEHPNKLIDLPDLGDPPYGYEVLLTLDGRQHVGTGRWPDDLAPAMSNQLRLAWSPPLPGWTGER